MAGSNILNRFDVPKPIRDLLDASIRMKVLDSADIYVMSVTYGDDWDSLREAVMEAAFACRMSGQVGVHEEMCILNDRASVVHCGKNLHLEG